MVTRMAEGRPEIASFRRSARLLPEDHVVAVDDFGEVLVGGEVVGAAAADGGELGGGVVGQAATDGGAGGGDESDEVAGSAWRVRYDRGETSPSPYHGAGGGLAAGLGMLARVAIDREQMAAFGRRHRAEVLHVRR